LTTSTFHSQYPVFAGIDVSKETFDLHLRPLALTQSLPHSAAGIRELLSILKAHPVELVVLEATGGYEKRIAAELAASHIPVVIVNPRQVRDFAKASGKLAKNDALDAAVLAHFADAIRPVVRPLPDAASQILTELVTRRSQLVALRTAEGNRLEVAHAPRVIQSIKRILSALDRQLQELDEHIDSTIESSPIWKEKDDLLQSVPGIGPTTSHALLAQMPELGSFSRRKAAALAGLAPYDHDSGKLRGLRCISGGRASVRNALYMAALTATRHNPVIRELYKRLRAKGKAYKLALTACMRKLLAILNHILKTKTSWRTSLPVNP
jgi:transposase